MKILFLGSSPISLILASLLNKSSNDVTIIENRRNIGGAWRLGKPFSQIETHIPIYNNIMIPCNEFESANFSRALKLLDLAGVSYEKPNLPIIVPKEFDKFQYRKINIVPLINLILNQKNIKFIRGKVNNLKVNDQSIEVDNFGSYDQVFMPDTIPFKKLSNNFDFKVSHKYIRSEHIHCLLPESSLSLYPNTFYSQPFSTTFDRGSFFPVSCNEKIYGLFRGRIAREFKQIKTKEIIANCPVISQFKILAKKRFIYISTYLSDTYPDDLKNKIKSISRINLLRTDQLVASLLSLEKYI